MNEKLYDLTNPQKNIWNTEQYFSGTSINNVGSIALINEPINFNKLSKSISNVLATHDNFRLRLVQDGNSIKQVFDNTINYVYNRRRVKIIFFHIIPLIFFFCKKTIIYS